MKILLLNPPLFDATKYGKPTLLSSAPGVGLGYIAAFLKKNGQEVKLIDMLRYDFEKVKEKIKEEKPDFIGITCLTEGRANAFKLARTIKEINPKIIVVLGGHHVTAMYEQVLKNYPVDFAVIGEGEITMLELIKALESNTGLKQIRGIAFKEGEKIIVTPRREMILGLDDLPFPLYDRFDIYPGLENTHSDMADLETNGIRLKDRKYAYVITSRGCPYNCQFCSSTKFWGHRYRFRSPKNIVDEIEMLNKNYGINYISFGDDAFTISSRNVIKTCKEILKRKLNIIWDCTTRADAVNEEMLRWMKKAGCLFIAVGVESGSPKIIKNINKHLDLQKVIEAFKLFHKVGILAYPLLMVGNPEESNNTVKKTVTLIKNIKPYSVAVSKTMVFPDTNLYYLAKNKKFINDNYWLTPLPAPYYTHEVTLDKLLRWELTVNASLMPFFTKIKCYLYHYLGILRDSFLGKNKHLKEHLYYQKFLPEGKN